MNGRTRTKFKKITIYTVRARLGGDLGIAKPCHLCVKWMYEYNVSKIVYSEHDGNVRILRRRDLEKEPLYITPAYKANYGKLSLKI